MVRASILGVRALALASLLLGPIADAAPRVTLGARETVIPSGGHGLKYFPDGPATFLDGDAGCRVLLTAGVASFLLEGPSIQSIASARRVLAPGKAGAFDNGYAGIRGVWRAPSGELAAIYHAEDQEGMRPLQGGVPGFYCRAALAVSRDGGATFDKLGPVLAAAAPKDVKGPGAQGLGEPCLVAEPEGRFLHAYYTSHERVKERGAQIGLARCAIAEWRDPGAWRKFCGGAFTEPGLGGRDTPVLDAGGAGADALFPHVVYVSPWRKFAMVYCVNAWREKGTPDKSGVYLAVSDDGLRWPPEDRRQLWKAFTLPGIGRELSWMPALRIEEAGAAQLRGFLYYGYSPSWGHQPPHLPHFLARRRIEIVF